MPKLELFVGKGGVGKTTVSAAYAVHAAVQDRRESVLLLSTDPAHSLADIFGQPIGDSPARIRLGRSARLDAWQVNAEKEFGAFLAAHREGLLSLLEKGSLFSRSDLEPLLDSALPGMAEMSALLAISGALGSGKYDRIVVDTAPFGHTLRLLALPESFAHFLNFLELAANRDQVLAAHFGGSAQRSGAELLANWRGIAERIEQALGSAAELVLVTSSEKFALNESLRAAAALSHGSPALAVRRIVLNRATLASGNCRFCRKRRSATRAAAAALKRGFPGAKVLVGEDAGFPIFGVAGLAAFGAHVFSGRPMRWKPATPKARQLSFAPAEWPFLATPLSLVLGKGGVGKTTVSAALGFHARAMQPRLPVEVCSVDPAPSLDDVFGSNVTAESRPVLGDAKFKASEMEAEKLFRAWAAGMERELDGSLTTDVGGVHVDLSFERRLFSSLIESVPPGLDEILAVLRISELAAGRRKSVVIDMAPTGHALDLLRTPERIVRWTRLLLKTLASHRTLALARDTGAKVAELGKSARDLLGRLKDSKRSGIFVVMLPEILPDRETERLVGELRSLGLSLSAIFVNRAFAAKGSGCAACRRAAQWRVATLAGVRKRFPGTVLYVIRDFPDEISGKAALRRFTDELWRVI